MHFFSMGSTDDEPHTSTFPANVAALPLEEQWKLFYQHLCQIVDHYVLPKQFMLSTNSESADDDALLHERYPHSRHVELEHNYCQAVTPVTQCLPCTITQVIQRGEVSQSVCKISIDGIFNYASAILNDGLLLLEFSDAIREGDDKRILRSWRAMLIYFQHARHTNYAKEAILLQGAVNATATPHLAAQITWSRTVNTRGGPGNNIPVDLHNEHLNHALKTAVAGMDNNVAANTIYNVAKASRD